MTFPPPEEVAFVGGDPDSNANECPAVWRAPGGVFMRGKTVDDGELAARFGRDVGKGEDETDIWLPDSLFEAIREAVTDTFEDDRQGPGQHDFASLLKATRRSLIRFEMRDSYDETEPGFDEWRKTGDVSTYDWGDHLDQVRESTARGVRWRRVRVVSSRRLSTSSGSMPVLTPTLKPGKTSDGCRARSPPISCFRGRTAGCSTIA